jgi:hypothetical protein
MKFYKFSSAAVSTLHRNIHKSTIMAPPVTIFGNLYLHFGRRILHFGN